MTKPEIRMNDEIRMTNKVVELIRHSGLVIGHSFVILVSTFVICFSSSAQEFRVRHTPVPDDGTKPPTMGAPSIVRGDEITPKQQQAVEKGLVWLANHQGREGSYGGDGMGKHAGITGLAGLAFMQEGNLPNRGKYGDNVNKCLDFILSASQESGLISADNSQGPMYGHGFATLFLAEVYGMTGDDRVKEKLQKAVRLIERTQNSEGGWRYLPQPYDADISVTICQVMALRRARCGHQS